MYTVLELCLQCLRMYHTGLYYEVCDLIFDLLSRVVSLQVCFLTLLLLLFVQIPKENATEKVYTQDAFEISKKLILRLQMS